MVARPAIRTGRSARLDKSDELVFGEAQIVWDANRDPCLLPAKYSADSVSALNGFVFEQCVTWDEASGVERLIPRHSYLERLNEEWFETMKRGQPLVIEKSRRLVVSWDLCACDIWDACRRRTNIMQGAVDYDKAQQFVYRCWFIYERLRLRNRTWNLPPAQHWGGNPVSGRLEKVAFANGSLIECLNSNAESFRGSGYTRVKLEELSAYRYVSNVFSQALAVTQGPPGTVGGHVVAVCNARANEEWQELKRVAG